MEEFEERKKQFIEEYKVLIDKLKLDIMGVPVFMPDGKGAFKLIVQMNIVDTKDAPTPSKIEDFL